MKVADRTKIIELLHAHPDTDPKDIAALAVDVGIFTNTKRRRRTPIVEVIPPAEPEYESLFEILRSGDRYRVRFDMEVVNDIAAMKLVQSVSAAIESVL